MQKAKKLDKRVGAGEIEDLSIGKANKVEYW
jgi:hypothetical protein